MDPSSDIGKLLSEMFGFSLEHVTKVELRAEVNHAPILTITKVVYTDGEFKPERQPYKLEKIVQEA